MNTQAITGQIVDTTLRSVVQAVEPDAEQLLLTKGAQVLGYAPHGLLYGEGFPYEQQLLLCWPPGTRLAYISPHDQEDNVVLFAVFFFPDSLQAFHLVYDYRSDASSRSFEEYFTLCLAHEPGWLFR